MNPREAYETPGSGGEVCPDCGGTGWKVVERAGLTGATKCECAQRARAQSLRDSSNIPLNYQNTTFDTFQMPNDNPVARARLSKAMLDVRTYVREFPFHERPGLILTGGTGAGKTHLAVAALKGLIEKGYEGLFFDYQNLLDRIRSGYDSAAGASDREAYRNALDVPILLLDDLGSHRVTEWVEDTVTSIITHRCNNKKALIATTNLTLSDSGPVSYTTAGGTQVHQKSLGDVIGARARSRLFEMCRVVDLWGVQDYREARRSR